jgi:ribosomal protein S18 acetylase RimI-like enzyme
VPDGLEIRAVEAESALRAWAHVFTIGYGMPPNWESTIFEVWSKIGLDFPVRNYLGYLDGEPVSTSTVFYSAGVAGIYDVATLPEARGRGLGTRLTLAPLLDARQAGYRIGILQSSDMGFGVYKRMGFRHLCQIENFYLPL